MKTLISIMLIMVAINPTWGYDCSKIMTIPTEGLLNYFANVTFPAPHNLTGEWVLDMDTDVEYTFLGGWGVWVRNNPSKGKAMFRSRDDALEIAMGDLINFRFRISWFTREPKPVVISMVWDGQQVCEDDGKTIKEIKASRERRTSNGRRGNRRRMAVN